MSWSRKTEERVFVKLRLDGGIVLDPTSPDEAQPAITTLEITRHAGSNTKGIN